MVKNIWSRMLSAILSMVLICALVPAVALADEGDEVIANDSQTLTSQNVEKTNKSAITSDMGELNTMALKELSADGIGVTSVSLGGYHSAAIKADGTLWTWGWNHHGQLGDGTTRSRTTPVKIMDGVASVSLGEYDHSAAIKTDGTLWMWGWNTYGQLGGGLVMWSSTPVKVMEDVAAVSLGDSHSAAIKTDGSLWMWGWNDAGALGDGTTVEDRNVPVKVMDNVASVSLGWCHSAAIKTDGTLWTWGLNSNGQLGDGTTEERNTPVKIMDGVASVSLGYSHSTAIKTDGTLWIWGDDSVALEYWMTWSSTPVKIMDDVTSVSPGNGYFAVIKTDGSLWTWGYSGEGRLGDLWSDGSTPVKVMENVAAVSLGDSHSAAIKTDGTLWTWGLNNCGQLGDDRTSTFNCSPVEIVLPASDIVVDPSMYASGDTFSLTGTAYYDYAHQVLDIVNKERTNAGVDTLTLDADLTDAAMQRAAELTVYYSHTRPNGETCFTATSDYGNFSLGENIAIGYTTPAEVMQGWFYDERDLYNSGVTDTSKVGHYLNIINPDFKTIGIGCFTQDDFCWEQMFSSSAGSGPVTDEAVSQSFNVGVNYSLCGTDRFFDMPGWSSYALPDVLNVGDTYQLTYCVRNDGWDYVYCKVDSSSLTWESSNPAVCSVDAKGVITAKSSGKATIKASFASGMNLSHEWGVYTSQTMYRLYNPNSGEHFYTKDSNEKDHLVNLGWYSEGTGWIAPTSGDPVYRLYNPYAGEHHYTMNTSEKDMLVSAGWENEGVGWYSGGDVRLYREYNPNAYANNHNYTTSESEHDWLLSLGWEDEGYAWNAVAAS